MAYGLASRARNRNGLKKKTASLERNDSNWWYIAYYCTQAESSTNAKKTDARSYSHSPRTLQPSVSNQ